MNVVTVNCIIRFITYSLKNSLFSVLLSFFRFAPTNRRAMGIVTSQYELNSSGAPGTPINGTPAVSVNFNHLGSVATLSSVPPPKNPKLYKTELCRSWMDHGRCNYGESEADLLANLPTPPSSVRSSHTCFIPQTCSQQLPCGPFTGGALSNQSKTVQDNILKSSSMLQRISSLPGYGSTGESTAGSSSVDSGSESSNGSFSPGLDFDDGGSFVTGFIAVHPSTQRGQQMSNSISSDMNRSRNDLMMNGLIEETMSLKFDEKLDKTPGRLPVFAQLSSAQ
ncbi:hypothetical protein DICVIV_09162 [Dictyocaulus viviparus]|uniref:C3H1-type domain-containing protein n=1 Tax=Dictyocaulus viviparus TaxID=29172 RepID=A0A0D8XJM3_DICVI|nr:hypothetical protein DICVIV_09162 [Dictyocaulus viviparus]